MSFPALYAVNEYLPDFSLAPCDFFALFWLAAVIALVWITTNLLSLIHVVCSLSSRNYVFWAILRKGKLMTGSSLSWLVWKTTAVALFFSRFLDQFRWIAQFFTFRVNISGALGNKLVFFSSAENFSKPTGIQRSEMLLGKVAYSWRLTFIVKKNAYFWD